MHSPTVDARFTCATCEAEIAGRPTFHLGLAFCCAGCVADGPCTCSYDLDDGLDALDLLDAFEHGLVIDLDRDREAEAPDLVATAIAS